MSPPLVTSEIREGTTTGTSNPRSISITVPSGTQLLVVRIVALTTHSFASTTVSFDGDALTKRVGLTDGNTRGVAIYDLISPIAKTANLTIAGTTASLHVQVDGLTNVDVSDHVGAVASVASFSSNVVVTLSPTAGVDDIVLGVHSRNAGSIVDIDAMTSQYQANALSWTSRDGVGGATNMTWEVDGGVTYRCAAAQVYKGLAAGAPVANAILFSTQPANTVVNQPIASFTASAVDDTQDNAVDTSFTDDITITNPSSDFTGTFTKAAVAGVATFNDIVGLKISTGRTVDASATGLTPATSAPFNITAPTTTSTQFEAEPMPSFVHRNSTDPTRRRVYFNITNEDGSDFSGSLTGLKGTLPSGPANDDIVRVAGALHYQPLTQPESDTPDGSIPVTLAASSPRRAAGGVGVVVADDWTSSSASIDTLTDAIVAGIEAEGVPLSSEQAAALVRSIFRAQHYLDGFGVARGVGDTQMAVIAPGDDPADVALTPATGRPSVIAAGAGVV